MDSYEEHIYSWMIGQELGINVIPSSKLPGAGYCDKHGHYTLCVRNSIPHSLTGVTYQCPYCIKSNEGSI